jgi:hypothetical protein
MKPLPIIGKKTDRNAPILAFKKARTVLRTACCKLTLKNKGDEHPDHATLVERYGKLSRERQGDDRYPVCSAGMMENELDTMQNKWVGPNCQLAPD